MVAEQEGNQQKVELLKNIKQCYIMKKSMDSQKEKNDMDLMIEGIKKEILKLEAQLPQEQHNLMSQNQFGNDFNQDNNPIFKNEFEENSIREEEIMNKEYNKDIDNYGSQGEYGDQYQMQPPKQPKIHQSFQEENNEDKQENIKTIQKYENNSYNNMEDRKSVVEQQEVERRLDDPGESLKEKRKKGIKKIFEFYSRQHLMIGKKATFEQIQYEMSNMDMGEFLKF